MVHLVTFTLSAKLPDIFPREPLLNPVMFVDMVELPEAGGPPQQQEAPPARVETKAPEPVVQPEAAVKIPVEPKAAPAPAPATVEPVKPVSLKPLKRKVVKTDPKKLAEEEARARREMERQKALAQAQQDEKRAKEAAEDARAELAEMIKRQGMQQATASSARGSSGRGGVKSLAEQIFQSGIQERIGQFWILPEMRQWKSSLETHVVVTILLDGSIARTVIEKKSGDPFYDQFVIQTLQKAAPLPAIPKMLKKDLYEVGLVFKPGNLSTM